MSNSREIMECRILLSNGNYQIFEYLCGFADDDTIVYKLTNLHNDEPICKADYLSIQEQTFTPPHKKNRRGKLKRSGR